MIYLFFCTKKMPYRTDGSSHINGIANEVNSIAYFNANPNCNINNRLRGHEETPLEWDKRGGTQQKADAVCSHGDNHLNYISIKNHKEKSGTYDLENTSIVDSLCPTVKQKISEYKTKNIGVTNVTPKMRDEVNTIFSNALDNCTSDLLKVHMEKVFAKCMVCSHIIVRNEPIRQFQMIKTENYRPLLLLGEGAMFFLKKRQAKKASRQLWIRQLVESKVSEINTNLRIRLTLNNGVGALFGLSNKNKTSVPSIKIQLDKVDSFIIQCDDLVVDSY